MHIPLDRNLWREVRLEDTMKKVKVGVAGYGVIGQRLADGVAAQGDMELVGVADIAPTISVRALKYRGMPYKMFNVDPKNTSLEDAGIPVSGSFEELVQECDIMLDSSPGGIGARNKELYLKHGTKAVFQGGESNDIADVFFHGYANYEQGIGADYLKLTSCNTTGLIRAVDMLDRSVGLEKVAITIIRRVADPGDYHRGLTNALQVEKATEPPGTRPDDDHAPYPVYGYPGTHTGDPRPYHHGDGNTEERDLEGRAVGDGIQPSADHAGTTGRRVLRERIDVPLGPRHRERARGHV